MSSKLIPLCGADSSGLFSVHTGGRTQLSLHVWFLSLDVLSSRLIRALADGGCSFVFRAELHSTGVRADSVAWLLSAQSARRAAISPGHWPLAFWEKAGHLCGGPSAFDVHRLLLRQSIPLLSCPAWSFCLCVAGVMACVVLRARVRARVRLSISYSWTHPLKQSFASLNKKDPST